jgi:sulfite exporter TauE/SafE
VFAFAAAMFALGLVTSVHCVSMCGPLILTYAVSGNTEGPWYRRLVPHLAYHGARFASYALVGLLLGAAGSVLNFDAIRPYALILAGGLMAALGLGMTGRVRWARYLTPKPPKFLADAIRTTRRKATTDAASGQESLATPLIFGLLTGILPCGPAVAAELASAATGSAATGALGMLAFGLGTAPLLLVFGASASLIPHRFKERMNLILAAAVMIWGLIFLNQALMLLGSPVTFAAAKQFVLGGLQTAPQSEPDWSRASDGVVEVTVAYVDMDFVPRDVRIPADEPVRLIVDRTKDDVGPPDKQIAVPQLHVLADVADDTMTPIAIPPVKAGSYTLTCGMGVMDGSIVAVGPQPAP